MVMKESVNPSLMGHKKVMCDAHSYWSLGLRHAFEKVSPMENEGVACAVYFHFAKTNQSSL
jgi:hypothetical protein